ncbi:hypothetical protein [Glaciibacter sp. 2TAF33]|uniref:hypothetical protein n=1 Tax=Glaciibacter sp. 2TAF33 TaxID=3233015 RepID=UPI003F918655
MTDPQNWQPPAIAAPSDAAPGYGEYLPVGAPNGWAPPPKPGLIPLRPLGFGTLLWAPFQVLKRNPKATFGSALLVQAGITLVTLVVVGLVTFFALSRVADAPIDEQDTVMAGATLTIVLSALVPVALSIIASALLQGIIVLEVARATLGEKLRLGALWRGAGRRLWPLALWAVVLGGALLLAIAIIGGLVVLLVVLGGPWQVIGIVIGVLGGLALVAASVWVFTRTSLVPSLIVLERLSIPRAVRRSWSLTTGYFWRTLGVEFLVAAIVNIVAQIVTTPLSILFGVAVNLVDPNGAFEAYIPSIVLYVLILFVALVLGAVAAVVQSATTALIYIDLRMRKEGLDLELQRFVESAASHAAGSNAQSGTGPVPDPYLT